MADIDIDPFGEHESRPEEPTDEHIPLTPVGGGSTWQPTREQETSSGGRESQRTKLMKDYVKDLYKKISENIDETPELFHYDYFKLEGKELYYIGNKKPLTTEGKLKSVGMLADIWGKNGLRRLGFNIPVGKITAQQAVMLEEFREYPGVYDDAMREDNTKRIDDLNDDLKVRQESIDLLKGRLKNQITSFKETIANMLDKDT